MQSHGCLKEQGQFRKCHKAPHDLREGHEEKHGRKDGRGEGSGLESGVDPPPMLH